MKSNVLSSSSSDLDKMEKKYNQQIHLFENSSETVVVMSRDNRIFIFFSILCNESNSIDTIFMGKYEFLFFFLSKMWKKYIFRLSSLVTWKVFVFDIFAANEKTIEIIRRRRTQKISFSIEHEHIQHLGPEHVYAQNKFPNQKKAHPLSFLPLLQHSGNNILNEKRNDNKWQQNIL